VPALSLTAIGGLLRVLPHPPNLAPVGAMSLFAGANLNGWQAYLVPLLIMALTDPILGMMHGFAPFSRSTVFIYGSFLISVRIGRQLSGKQKRRQDRRRRLPVRLAVLCNYEFFHLLLGNMYPHTVAGLASCYVAALPFFGYTLIGNLFYSVFFFGAHFWLTRRQTRPGMRHVRLVSKKEAPLTGAPAVRRQKTYSAESGYVYQYYYEGQRPASRDGSSGIEFVFNVSADRNPHSRSPSSSPMRP